MVSCNNPPRTLLALTLLLVFLSISSAMFSAHSGSAGTQPVAISSRGHDKLQLVPAHHVRGRSGESFPANICFHYTEEITAPLARDPISYDGERRESAWNYALSEELTPSREEDREGNGTFWISHDDEYLNIFADNYSSHSFDDVVFLVVGLDTRADGRTCPPSEDDFAITVYQAKYEGRLVFGYPSDDAVPYIQEVKWSIHIPFASNSTDFVRYEVGVPLKTLTFYQHTAVLGRVGIRIHAYGADNNGISFPASTPQHGDDTISYLNFAEKTVAELVDDAESSVQWAWAEGRTEGLEQARSLLKKAQAAYDAGEYTGATALADQAKKLADDATRPPDYYVAETLLANATQLKLSMSSSQLSSSEALTLFQRGLDSYESAEKAFKRRDFAATIAYARNATTLFKGAVSAEEAYRASELQKQILTYGLSGFALVITALAIVYLVRRRRPPRAL